jgi:hypothetical protein
MRVSRIDPWGVSPADQKKDMRVHSLVGLLPLNHKRLRLDRKRVRTDLVNHKRAMKINRIDPWGVSPADQRKDMRVHSLVGLLQIKRYLLRIDQKKDMRGHLRVRILFAFYL